MELNDEQSCTAAIDPRTPKGNPAPVHGLVAWEIEDATVCSFEIDPADSKKGRFAALAGEGVRASEVRARFDADMGDGVREVVLIGQIVVKDAEAAGGEIVFGPAE